jgi:hypothetical protein
MGEAQMSDYLVRMLRGEKHDFYNPEDNYELCKEAADRIEELERINRQIPAILEYLEEEASPIGTENGFVPNKALVLLNGLKMAIENTWID